MKTKAFLFAAIAIVSLQTQAQTGSLVVGLEGGVSANMYSTESSSSNEYLKCLYACMLVGVIDYYICPRGRIGVRLGCWRRGERFVFMDVEDNSYYNYMVLGLTGTFLILKGPCWFGVTGGPNFGCLTSRGQKSVIAGQVDKQKVEIQKDGPDQDAPLQVGLNAALTGGMKVGPGSITGQLGIDYGLTGLKKSDASVMSQSKHRNFYLSAGYEIPLSAIFGGGNDERGRE